MESYAFRTKYDELGFFQKNDDDCILYLHDQYFPKQKQIKWSKWDKYRIDYPDTIPPTTTNDLIGKAVSFFLWSENFNVIPDIVEFAKTPKAGSFHPRTNRGSAGLFSKLARGASVIDEVRSYYNIVEAMEELFKVIEPDVKNINVFGHRIREVLTIACTEVEYLLLQYLKENNFPPPHKDRYNTSHYVKVLDAIGLNKFEVSLKMHPAMGVFSPFKAWSKDKPTESLAWYSAYNATKHDRGGNFYKATLGALVNAVSAIHILLEAQYGSQLFDKPMQSQFESCFFTRERCKWSLSEIHVPILNYDDSFTWEQKTGYFQV